MLRICLKRQCFVMKSHFSCFASAKVGMLCRRQCTDKLVDYLKEAGVCDLVHMGPGMHLSSTCLGNSKLHAMLFAQDMQMTKLF